MEDGPTQPSTLPVFDRRRAGESRVGDENLADIICFLQPGSDEAKAVIWDVAKRSPKHVYSKDGLLEASDNQNAANVQPEAVNKEKDRECPCIALRFSSLVKDLCMGFVFGRNAEKSDIVLNVPFAPMAVSGVHFRIYVREGDILMLEDCSTNGTGVDGQLIMCSQGAPKDAQRRQMIIGGSVITILNKKMSTKFIVVIPQRGEYEEVYQDNLEGYLQIVKAEQEAREARVKLLKQKGDGGRLPPKAIRAVPPPLNIQRSLLERESRVIIPHPSPHTLAGMPAGAKIKDHGMHWNGGDVYNITGVIGRGAFAVVYRAATKAEGDLYAIKEISKRSIIKSGQSIEKVFNELNIMKKLDHPHIVKYFDYEDTKHDLYIIMEYVPWGDARTLGRVENRPGQSVARQLCHALKYLHTFGIAHRDIKPDNILISDKSPLTVKLSDFGLSKLASDETFLETFCGTLLYCAPEVYPEYQRFLEGASKQRRTRAQSGAKKARLPYDFAVDMWSFGAVMFHMLSGHPPYEATRIHSGADMFHCIMNKDLDVFPLQEAGFGDDAVDFCSSMLRVEPSQRPTAAQCLEHPWIRHVVDVLEVSKETDEGLRHVGEQCLPDASQLSIHEDVIDEEDDDPEYVGLEVDEMDFAGRAIDTTYEARATGLEEGALELDSFASLPSVNNNVQLPFHQPQPGRLFGELGESGVLGVAAELGVSGQGNSKLERSLSARNGGFEEFDQRPRAQHSEIKYAPLQYQPSLLEPGSHHPIGSAPSLLGTEAQIGQLNMASPESAASAPDTPRTPSSRQASPSSMATLAGSKHFREAVTNESNENTPKRPRVTRPIKSSSFEHPEEQSENPNAKEFEGTPETQRYPGDVDTADSQTQINDRTVTRKELAAAAETAHIWVSSQGLHDVNAGSVGHTRGAGVSTDAMPSENSPNGSLSASQPKKDDSAFVKPPIRLGKLVPLPGSITDSPIKLEKRLTSFGRYPNSDVVYPDPLDTRVPKAAIDILFWRPGIERELREGGAWMEIKDVWAVVATRSSARSSVCVNGVQLPHYEDVERGWHYGILRHGDVVSIFDTPTAFLKYRCEFYHGLSQTVRPEGEPFAVELELEKFTASKSGRVSVTGLVSSASSSSLSDIPGAA